LGFITILLFITASVSVANAAYLKGKVIDQKNQQPVAGVAVWLEGTEYYALSDINGDYALDNIPDGIYTIIVGGQNYHKRIYMHFGIGIYAEINQAPPEKPPEDFRLEQNYPNPFNPRTTVSYQLPTASNVKLEIFDSLGRHVITLANGRQNAGLHMEIWNAENADHKKVASGVYYCRLQAGNWQNILKMILID